MKYDLPPTENITRPNYDSKIERRIREIALTDSGKPLLRIVWGASMDSSYIWAGEQHMVYRDHIKRENRLGWPEYGLDGKFSHYRKMFELTDVVPADVLLDAVILEEDIGIPRYFIEYATSVDPDEWEIARWVDESGQVRLDDRGNAIDFRGPCPEGAVIYEPLWLCADHQGCCVKVGHMNIGQKADREQCFGIYRDPNMRDVRECEARWADVMMNRSDKYGLRDEVPGEFVRQDVSTAVIGHQNYWDKREEVIRGDYLQNMMPHRHRLTSEGSGLDLATYKDVGGTTQKLAENAKDPDGFSGKLIKLK
jgi:hypothetical protein